MTTRGQPTLQQVLETVGSQDVEKLDLTKNASLGLRPTEAMTELCLALKSNNSIKTLILRELELSDGDVELLCDVLSVNSSIEELDLGKNKITSDGVVALSKVLATNQSVATLHLRDQKTALTEEVVTAFGDTFQQNLTLTKLQWDVNSKNTNVISKYITRNNDISRCIRQGRDYVQLLPDHLRDDPPDLSLPPSQRSPLPPPPPKVDKVDKERTPSKTESGSTKPVERSASKAESSVSTATSSRDKKPAKKKAAAKKKSCETVTNPVRKPPDPVSPFTASPRKSVDALTSAFQDSSAWKKKKVFDVNSCRDELKNVIRGILEPRGWVENKFKGSPCWDLKLAFLRREIGKFRDLNALQCCNYFERDGQLCTKVGLTNNLMNSCVRDNVSVDDFHPRAYDMKQDIQIDQFIEDFKLTKCVAILRRVVSSGGTAAFPVEAIEVAIKVCERRYRSVDESLDDWKTVLINRQEWAIIETLSLLHPGSHLKPLKKKIKPWEPAPTPPVVTKPPPNNIAPKGKAKPKPKAKPKKTVAPVDPDIDLDDDDDDSAGDAADGSIAEIDENDAYDGNPEDDVENEVIPAIVIPTHLYEKACEMVEAHDALGPQSLIDGEQDIWLLKPASKSRGRGIQLSSRLDKILDISKGRGSESRWIVQKYIENPQVIGTKKFDIRQWVVVTSWQPLAIWFYNDAYVRFAFADYDTSKLKNRLSHLTNNSIAKHAQGFKEVRDETMWHTDAYRDYLRGLEFRGHDGNIIADPWIEIVQPKMKQIAVQSLEAVQDVMDTRVNSWELFGYDFMVADNLDVWLIEVNSSPDMSFSTSTTEGLVKAMIGDMMKVIVDAEQFGSTGVNGRPRQNWGKIRIDTGRFELLEPERRRQEQQFTKAPFGVQMLSMQGTKIPIRRRGASAKKCKVPVTDLSKVSLADLEAAKEPETTLCEMGELQEEVGESVGEIEEQLVQAEEQAVQAGQQLVQTGGGGGSLCRP